jgi:hypothetical protein
VLQTATSPNTGAHIRIVRWQILVMKRGLTCHAIAVSFLKTKPIPKALIKAVWTFGCSTYA